MPKSDSEIERAIDSLKGTMAIEGLTLNDDDIADCRAIMTGDANVDEMLSNLLNKYRVTDDKDGSKHEAS